MCWGIAREGTKTVPKEQRPKPHRVQDEPGNKIWMLVDMSTRDLARNPQAIQPVKYWHKTLDSYNRGKRRQQWFLIEVILEALVLGIDKSYIPEKRYLSRKGLFGEVALIYPSETLVHKSKNLLIFLFCLKIKHLCHLCKSTQRFIQEMLQNFAWKCSAWNAYIANLESLWEWEKKNSKQKDLLG